MRLWFGRPPYALKISKSSHPSPFPAYRPQAPSLLSEWPLAPRPRGPHSRMSGLCKATKVGFHRQNSLLCVRGLMARDWSLGSILSDRFHEKYRVLAKKNVKFWKFSAAALWRAFFSTYNRSATKSVYSICVCSL